MKIEQQKYLRMANNKFLFRLFTLTKLPSLAFWGIKVKEMTQDQCDITLKMKYTTQNPFKSIYFAALNGAAELSTGMLVQLHIQGEGRWSMLVVGSRCVFTKKARGTIVFTCDQGQEVRKLIAKCIAEGSSSMELESIGVDEQGAEIGRFYFTWSLQYKG